MARRKKTDDEPDDINEQHAGNDDTFGLPEIEYEPINRENPPPEEDVKASAPAPAEPIHQKAEYTEEQPVTNTPMEREEN